MENIKRYENAKMLAIRMHGLQTYDKFPYHKHLQDVEDVLVKFDFDKYSPIVCAAWLHDILEDCPISYSDIQNEFGYHIAEIVYHVTDELGRNRKEKKEKTYPKVRENTEARIVKIADRIANVEFSKEHSKDKFEMYKKEHREFRENIYFCEIEKYNVNVYSQMTDKMCDYLDNLFKEQ